MRASANVGRVGGLAVALGVGAAVTLGYSATASADPVGDSTSATAASDSTPGPRSRRPANAKAAKPLTPRPAAANRVRVTSETTSLTRPAVRAPAASAGAGAAVAAPVKTVASKTASANSANPILSFFFNQTPTASPTRGPQSPTGVINGDVNATDADGDLLTYTVVAQPAKGAVTVDATGHYVYTPNADLVAAGGIDAFTVQVSDAESGFHIHGLLGLINLLTFGLLGSSGHTARSTINLSVLAATTTAGTPSASTGVLTGSITASGVAGDQFSYSGSTTSKGTAAFADGSIGDFTYTPTPAARHAAAKLDATAAEKSDTFSLTVTDNLGGSLTLPVTTAITPANGGPTATQNTGSPDVASGLVAGAVIGSDADGDPLTYTGSTTTAKGVVVVNDQTGSFTYTPTALARHNAAFNADTTDSFTVTVTDGYGGSVDVPVTVTISPASVTFAWTSGSGSQYWTAANMAALDTAATRLSSYIVVGTPVTITTKLIGQNNPGSNYLASSYTNFAGGGAGYYGTVVQKKILTGIDANGTVADSQLTWNFAYPWALGDTVAGNQYDFQSVAMHEMVHSLGFLSGIGSPASIDTNWSTYDSFLSTSAGTAVIDPNYTFNTAYTANLTGGNGGLYFDGPNAVAVYGGLVPLYTPGTWASGTSVTHLNPTPVKPAGTTGYLMDPSDGYGLGVRVITPVEVGILEDLGYTIVTPSGASVFVILGFGLMRRRRR